jgi:hypothetical protein
MMKKTTNEKDSKKTSTDNKDTIKSHTDKGKLEKIEKPINQSGGKTNFVVSGINIP